jgi:hypothetical protein
MTDFTWLGDAQPDLDSITMYGHVFVKGKPTSVPDTDPFHGKLAGATNAFSAGKAKAELVDEDDTQEVADLKAELDVRNVKYRANASADSLYKLLQKDEDDKAEAAKLARS